MKKTAITAVLVLALNMTAPCMGIATAEGNAISISFGEKLTAQEQSGYVPYTGATMLDNFNQAQSELPDEVPVLENFAPNGANEFYVSTSAGTDGSGTINAPFGTIFEALEAVSALSDSEKAQGTVIWLRGGIYTAEDTIAINEAHTSSNGTLFISAYNDENVILSGQHLTEMSQAVKVSKDNMSSGDYNRMNNRAVDNIYYIDYETLGVNYIPYEKSFYYNDIRLHTSRYPNQGNDTPVNVIVDGSWIDSEGFTRADLPAEWESYYKRPFEWVDTGNIHVYGRIANDWSITDGVISLDKTNQTIKTTDGSLMTNNSPITTNFYGKTATSYYYTNIFEELDEAGEFFTDNNRKRLYFYPPADSIDEADTVGFSQNDGYIFEVSNAANVVFDGINILNAASGIKISDSTQIVVQDADIKNLEGTAVYMYNTEKCGIINSSAGQSDASSLVIISQSNNRSAELKPRRNFVQNTYLYNAPRAMTVSNYTSGNIISHNLFENMDYAGITLNGSENIIEYNEFSGVVNKISDGGAIYVGGNILNRANTIRYNYFHDSKPDSLNARAVYNDDCSDMSWNYGNVIKNYGHGLFLHSGDDHVIKDNIVINTTAYIRNSADYSAQQNAMAGHLFKKSSPGFWNSYDSLKIGESETWMTRYKGILDKKRQAAYDAREAYHSDADMFSKIQTIFKKKNVYSDYTNGDDVKKVCDFVADTGCYYLNNTLVINQKNSWGYGPSDYGVLNIAEPANVTEEPTQIILGSKEETDSYDISDKIKGMGLISTDKIEETRPVIFMKNGTEIQNSDFTGVSWSTASNLSYYKLEIALDPEFENVVVSSNTSANEYARYMFKYNSDTCVSARQDTSDYTYLNDTPYYARVTAVSLAECVQNSNTVSDTVEFILRDKINYNRSGVKTVTEYGDISHMVTVSGKVPSYLLNDKDKQITIMLYDGGKTADDITAVKQIRQINPNDDNTFSYSFKADDTENLRIRIKAADGDLADDLFGAVSTVVQEIKFTVTKDDITVGDVVSAAAEVNNKFDIVDEFTIIVAAYDSTNKLIKCAKSQSFTPESGKTSSEAQILTIPENTAYVKAFMWQMTKLKPWSDMIRKDIQATQN